MNLASPLDYLGVFKTTTRTRWDAVTPFALIGLSLFGLAFIYSAQLSVRGSDWIKQLVFLFVGAGLYVGVSLIDYRVWLSLAHRIYALAMVPLLLVLIPGVGSEVFGSQRWINLGFFSFQPSETAKVAVLLITASTLIRNEVGTIQQSLGVLGKLALAVGFPMLLVLLQPDLKSAIVLPPMVFSMLYVSKLSVRFYAAALGVFVLLVSIVAWDSYNYVRFMDSHGYSFVEKKDRGKYEALSWVPLHDYQRNRILAFAERRAQTIRSQGDREAAKEYESFAKNEDFAIFLRKVEALKKMLDHNTTFVLSADSLGILDWFNRIRLLSVRVVVH
jgi:rod shape determining protein RodA